MHATKLAGFGLATALAVSLSVLPAQALNYKSFVSSSTGSDSNDCSFASPCLSMIKAVAQTQSTGMVSCLDTGDYSNAVTITISVTIDCGGTAASAGPFTINGNNIEVVIRNLTTYAFSGPAITLIQGAQVLIDNVHMTQMGSGIAAQPTTASKLFVSNSIIDNNGGGGVLLKPSAGGSLLATFDHVSITNNAGGGIKADGTGGGPVTVSVAESSISHNASNGVNAVSAAGGLIMFPVLVHLTHNIINSNGLAGVQASGGATDVTVNTSSLMMNGTALNMLGGSHIFTFGDNHVVGPIGNGFFQPPLTTQ